MIDDEQQKEFEQRLSDAISTSLSQRSAPSDLRARLLGRLEEEEKSLLKKPDLSEEEALQFERSLSRAVERSQEWSPEDEVVVRTEVSLSAEFNQDFLSERSVGYFLDSANDRSGLKNIEINPEKLRFLQAVRSEVKRSTGELVAPESLRRSILASLELGDSPPKIQTAPENKVVALPTRSQWKRAVGVLSSLAAGFAIVVLTLFGSADVALANSVRADHKTCCKSALQMQRNGPPSGLQAMLESKYGKVPVPPVDESWKLRISKICRTDDGQAMVHLLYTREIEDEKLESLSFHFFPDDEGKRNEQYSVNEESVHILTDGEFPVVAWKEGDWVSTACSPELDAETLKKEVQGL